MAMAMGSDWPYNQVIVWLVGRSVGRHVFAQTLLQAVLTLLYKIKVAQYYM